MLPVEVDVEELAVPQRLADPVRKVQARHLLVADLGVQTHQARGTKENLSSAVGM